MVEANILVVEDEESILNLVSSYLRPDVYKVYTATDGSTDLKADQTINDLRHITRDLRPLYLEDLGLVATFEMLANVTSISIDITIEFLKNGPERRFSQEIELTPIGWHKKVSAIFLDTENLQRLRSSSNSLRKLPRL